MAKHTLDFDSRSTDIRSATMKLQKALAVAQNPELIREVI